MSKKLNTDLISNIFRVDEASIRQKAWDRIKTMDNRYSFWAEAIEKSDVRDYFSIPKTEVVFLEREWFEWLTSDRYTEDKIQELNKLIVSGITKFNNGEKLFIKTGQFSGKFEFDKCTVEPNQWGDIGKKYLSIFYFALCVDCDVDNEVVIREYIDRPEAKVTIYNGMPLTTEFRYFYDFDKRELLGVSEYWHDNYMKRATGDTYEVYSAVKHELHKVFDENKLRVAKKVEQAMKKVSLSGRWSVDIMQAQGVDYLIDMAKMENSALVDVMQKIDRSRRRG